MALKKALFIDRFAWGTNSLVVGKIGQYRCTYRSTFMRSVPSEIAGHSSYTNSFRKQSTEISKEIKQSNL